MPIYEYLCESCGKVNEQLQKVNEPPPARCDECGSRKLAKLVSRSAFQLKGGGWYSDLYASKKAPPAKEPEQAASSKEAAGQTPGQSGAPATPVTPASPAAASPTPSPAAPVATPAPPKAQADPASRGRKSKR
jgi:putative FmdB family regulatory protein